MYTITLNDGTKLENLELNGNNFIAEGIIEDSVFANNLAKVIITDGEITDTYTDMFLAANRAIDGKSWFVIAEKTEEMKRAERVDALEAQNETLLECLLEMSEIVYA